MRKKRTISLLLVLAMVFSLIPSGFLTQTAHASGSTGAAWDGSSTAQPAQGNGSADDPYQISTGEELAWFSAQARANHPDICGILTADIDLGSHAFSPIYGGTTEIEDDWDSYEEDVPYTGTFDGDGHVITGYYSADGGLFKLIQNAAIQNLGIEGEITSQSGSIGSLVDESERGGASTVSNCYSRVSMNPGANSGGLVGNTISAPVNISDCYYAGEFCASGSPAVNTGGIIGNLASSTVVNCYTTYHMLVGRGSAENVTNSYYVGSEGSHGVGVSADELKAKAADLGSSFTADKAGINDGYPLLAWQAPAAPSESYDWALTVYPQTAEVTVTESASGSPVTAKSEENVVVQSFYDCTKRVYELQDGVSYTYTVQAPGFFSVEETILPNGQPPKDVSAILHEQYTLTFKTIPENAVITLNSEEYGKMEPSADDAHIYQIPDGYYTYTAEADGYESVIDGEISTDYFNDNAFTESVTLKPVPYTITFAGLTPSNASLTVAEKGGRVIQPAGPLTYQLAKGEYTWTASCEGYTEKSGEFTVSGNAAIDAITLDEAADKQVVTFHVTGADGYTIAVTGASTGAVIEGSGDVWNLAAGNYRYSITKDGCTPVQGSFTVSGQPVDIHCSLTASGTVWDGTDTAVEPSTKTIDEIEYYVINTPAELVWFAHQVNNEDASHADIHAQLGANLDLGGHEWKRIGTYNHHFAGIFDGNGHSISGLAGQGGLFYSIDEAGTVKNLTIHADLENTTVGFGGGKIGAVSNENYGTIENCDAHVSIVGGGQWLGGITALNFSTGHITGCSAHGSVTSNYQNLSPDRDSASAHAGGIAGKNYGSIENCYSTASVTNNGNNKGSVGGITGSMTKDATIKNVYAVGKVRSTLDGGSAVGYAENTSGVMNTYGCQDAAPLVVGNAAAAGNAKTAAELRSDAFVIALRGDGNAFNKASSNAQNMGFPVLTRQGGSEPDVSELDGWQQLQEAKNALTLEDTDGLGLTADDQGIYQVDHAMTLKLPAAGEKDVTISWSSSDPAIIHPDDGRITLPENGTKDIKLTASLSVTNAQGETLRDTRDFAVHVWSVPAKQESILNEIKEALNGDLARTWLQPSWEANDRNVIVMMQQLLKDKGYSVSGEQSGDYDVQVSLKNIGELVYGNPNEDYIASDGSITYFYEDPKTWNGVHFAQRKNVTFTLTLGQQTVDVVAGITIPWDADKVIAQMDQYLKDLTWDDIKGENPNASKITDEGTWPWSEAVEGTISKDLILPRVLADFPYAEVRWSCFKPNLVVTQVSDQIRDPLVGHVVRTKDAARVVLTAEMSFSLVDSTFTDAAPITTSKTFAFTVQGSGIDPSTQGQRLKDYPSLLRDAVEKDQVVDSASVTGDIQLPTPTTLEKAGILNRETERVTVVSSDTDLMEVNGYRAVVYRPLPGRDPITISYTVNISERGTNALIASRDFTLTIQPLTQAEIDEGLALMDRVKSNYFDAIKGENPSAAAVTENLKTFAEAVPDGKDIKFIRGAGGLVLKGIITDELPGYDPMAGQSWRLFRSDKPTVIEDEVLRVHRQKYDTPVTVSSVLTHAVYGKYWEKFNETENAPQYEQFAALYKQPVQAELTVKGTSGSVNPDPQPQKIAVTVTIDGGDVDGFTSLQAIQIKDLDPYTTTAWDALHKAMTDHRYQWTGGGSYISAITDPNGIELAEREHGSMSGWMYKVNNGGPPDKALNQYYLSDGDILHMYYVAKESSKFTLHYESNGGTVYPDETYEPDAEVELDKQPSRDGFRFDGWFADPALTEKVTMISMSENKTVYAGWSRITPVYTVTWKHEDGRVLAVDSAVSEGTMPVYGGPTPEKTADKLHTYTFAGWTPEIVPVKGNQTYTAVFTATVNNPFRDVSKDSYYYQPVLWAVEHGITAGVAADRFGSDQTCTRGQIVTFLWASAGKPEPKSTKNPFTDIKTSDYYYQAVLWAVENKITAGVSTNRFAPNQLCTRAQAVTFLWANAGKPVVQDGHSFSDVPANSYYADAVKWAVKHNITAGVGGNRFGPSQSCQRAQIVTFLYQAQKLSN